MPRTKTGPPLSSCVVQPPHKNKKKEGGGKRQKRRKPQLQNHFREIGKGPQKKQAVPRKPEIWGYLTEPLKSLTRTKRQQKKANQHTRNRNNQKRQRETPNRKEMVLLQCVRVCVCVYVPASPDLYLSERERRREDNVPEQEEKNRYVTKTARQFQWGSQTKKREKARSLKGSKLQTNFPKAQTCTRDQSENSFRDIRDKNKNQETLRLTKRGGGAHGLPRPLLRRHPRRP